MEMKYQISCLYIKKKYYVLYANSEVIKDVPTVNYNYIIILWIIDLTIKIIKY